jgi:uncharacterized protein (TIGR03086 family)
MAETATVQQVADQLQGFIDRVPESQLGSSTPCTEWNVRELLNHVTGGGILFAACLRHGSCPDDLLTALMTEDQVGADPSASFRAAASDFLDAAEGADPDKVVTTPWGEMPVAVVLDIATADLSIHTIDLAVATGADLDDLDPQLLATADELAHKYFPPDARGTNFGPPVDVDANVAPALRLAAYAGRSV